MEWVSNSAVKLAAGQRLFVKLPSRRSVVPLPPTEDRAPDAIFLMNSSLYLSSQMSCLSCVQLFHQRRDIDVIHAAAFDVRDRTVPAPLP